jgi:hypothetical protein
VTADIVKVLYCNGDAGQRRETVAMQAVDPASLIERLVAPQL